ncbi:hypothetical protein TNIN_151891 [Trichonephila inaurata madagascariensis]|uniref:Uncharacterized protein n=1 Tax=Trichonephila inaurata madagascariensis TaxID=2747483 RepID=A0A8X7CHB2_9ARAC|nr:hypothetical protein TNIN_151891 [Trichonephila inaurata madagascariensis]
MSIRSCITFYYKGSVIILSFKGPFGPKESKRCRHDDENDEDENENEDDDDEEDEKDDEGQEKRLLFFDAADATNEGRLASHDNAYDNVPAGDDDEGHVWNGHEWYVHHLIY